MNSDKYSCGARDKTKCSKESGLQGGKMCLKTEDCPELPEISIEKSIEISERGRKKLLDWYNSGQDWFIDDTIGVDWKTFIGEKDVD